MKFDEKSNSNFPRYIVKLLDGDNTKNDFIVNFAILVNL